MTKNTLNTSTSQVPGVLRSLGAFEEIYWLYTQTGPRGFAYAAEVEGPTTVDAWRNAIDQVQQSQPFFSACIETNPSGKPYFRHVAGASIPMRVLNGISEHRWETEMAKEVFEPFSGDVAPLVRTVLIHEPARSIFIIAAHHSVSDGISMTVVLRDLLRALSGAPIDRYPMLPSQEEALGITGPSRVPAAESESSAAQLGGPPSAMRGEDTEPPTISSLCLDSDLTTRLVKRARGEGTTMHGAICSAVLWAGRQGSRSWSDKPVRIFSDINTRKACEVGSTSAMYFLGGISPIEPGLQVDFWDLARRFIAELAGPRSREGLKAACQALTDVASQGLDPAGIVQFLSHAFAFEAIISNVGKLPFSSNYGRLRLESIWGSSFLTGAVDEQILGVATVGERLHLLYTSYTPIPSFLENIQILLSEACSR
jgi:phthiocerol/phthiodiolone dimycocerosyl transferase-like enzyme